MKSPVLFLLLNGAVALGISAQAVPDAARVRGTLAFDASATLGAFTGSTSTLTGRLAGAPTLAGVRGWVEAPARSLTSRNGKRDRDTWSSLEVEKYPTIRFDLDSVAPGATSGDSQAVALHGRFHLHGAEHAATLHGWLWRTGAASRFRGATPLNVKDYGVGGLTKALGMLRMNEHITVRVDVSFDSDARE
ncbi:MAG: YceI family protein [Gemmatimonadota bacterium]